MFDGYLTVAFGVPTSTSASASTRDRTITGYPRRLPIIAAPLAPKWTVGRAGIKPHVLGDSPLQRQGRAANHHLSSFRFLHPETDKILKKPDWSRLELWDRLRARWFGLTEPDPFDRLGQRFRHE